MIDFIKELNSEQLEVVAHGDGYCLVLAGAGSGKTRTITYRVAHLLEKCVKPENILLLTFTNKAAKEMLGRVEKIIGKKPDGLWGGTFHAIANRILRATAPLLGYQPNFSVLDQDDAETLLKSCVKELHFSDSKRFPSAGLIHALYSFSRNAQITLTEAIDWKNSSFSKVAGDIEEATNLYQKKKKSSNVMDFDDLLINWYEVLQKSAVLKKLAEQFQYILIDEYQDTNRLQATIVKLLASVHKNLLVVGDDAQSIYSFRAADINNILEFPKEFPKAKIFRLETNYRSTPNILNLANDRQRVRKLQEAGNPLKDLAVLFRAAFHAQILEIELAKAGIPYEMRGGMRFFERAHIKDTISILRVVNNLKDEIAWFRVLEIFQGIGHETARMIIAKACQSKDLLELSTSGIRDGLNKNAQKGWDDFVSIAEVLNEKKEKSA
ncbi:MAG: UvrD-helicase domain-containing protein, partial [Candidatus Magasanikbacteria bacterium]|nr:UvrD-helicase domain-containing protein [Candidatus Magasanikbacteria bacterium]